MYIYTYILIYTQDMNTCIPSLSGRSECKPFYNDDSFQNDFDFSQPSWGSQGKASLGSLTIPLGLTTSPARLVHMSRHTTKNYTQADESVLLSLVKQLKSIYDMYCHG